MTGRRLTSGLCKTRSVKLIICISATVRSKHAPERERTLGPRIGANVARLGSHIVRNGLLHPRHEKVRALAHNVLLDARETIENDSAMTAGNYASRTANGKRTVVHAVLQHTCARAEQDGGGAQSFQRFHCRHVVVVLEVLLLEKKFR